MIVYCLLPDQAFLPLNKLTAVTAGSLLAFFGNQAVVRGTVISLESFTVEVITECSVLFPATLYASFVLTHPLCGSQKISGLFWGLMSVFCFNAARIALVAWCGFAYPGAFVYLHVYFGQVLLMLFVIAACLICQRMGSRDGKFRGELIYFYLRLAICSAALFGMWVYVNRFYIGIGDAYIQVLFSLFHYRLFIPMGHMTYYHTFNMVLFFALMLSSRFRRERVRIAGLLFGAAVLFTGHILFRVCNVFMTGFEVSGAYGISTILAAVGQYVLPFGLWQYLLWADHREVFSGHFFPETVKGRKTNQNFTVS